MSPHPHTEACITVHPEGPKCVAQPSSDSRDLMEAGTQGAEDQGRAYRAPRRQGSDEGELTFREKEELPACTAGMSSEL